MLFELDSEQEIAINPVKISELDELIAAFNMFDSYVFGKVKKAITDSAEVNFIVIWSEMTASTKVAVSTILKLSGIKQQYGDFTVNELTRLLLDNGVTKEQAIIRKINGFSMQEHESSLAEDVLGDDAPVLLKYLTLILFYLGTDSTNFESALALTKQLTPEDCNQLLTSLNDIRNGKTPQTKKMKKDLELSDKTIEKFLIEAGFIVKEG